MDSRTPGTRKLLLKPSNFQSTKEENGSASENGCAASPTINNPFLKCEKDESEAPKQDEKEDEKDPVKQSSFKPTKTNPFANATSSALSDSSSFVFGQNLRDRVVIENVNSTPEEQSTTTEAKSEEPHLFSLAATTQEKEDSNGENTNKGDDVPEPEESKETETVNTDKNFSLVEAARKYEEMRGAQKRKYEEVEITTGEEDERNILEISCKLFTFIENNYEERGRGIFRLNDSKTGSNSRVVFRASGSFRLLLNTKVWRDQICEQPSPKSLRLTAYNDGVIKIYLVMGRVDDMSHLYRVLSSRIRKEKEKAPNPEPEVTQEEENVKEPACKIVVIASE